MTEILHRSPKFAGGLVAIMLSAFALAGWSFIQGHGSACDSRNATADLFHDVIVIASKPTDGEKPQPLTAAQKQRRRLIFARIDAIRC